MKIKLLFTFFLLNTLSFAGEYEDHCTSKFPDIKLETCLDEIQEKSKKILIERIQTILSETAYYSELTIKDFRKSNKLFVDYVNAQCQVLLVLPREVASETTVKDCEIKMTTSRIQELDAIFSKY